LQKHRVNAHEFFVSYRVATNSREAETLAFALGAGEAPPGMQGPLKVFFDKHCLAVGE
jgi:hypothetical protein